MCRCGQSRASETVSVAGIPCEVSRCKNGTHGSGVIGMPDGGHVQIEAQGKTDGEMYSRFAAIAVDVSRMAEMLSIIPIAGLLALGISIVEPGKKIEAPSKTMQAEIKKDLDLALSGQAQELLSHANGALVLMGPRSDLGARRKAEAYYGELIKQGLDRMVNVLAFQRTENLTARDNAISGRGR